MGCGPNVLLLLETAAVVLVARTEYASARSHGKEIFMRRRWRIDIASL